MRDGESRCTGGRFEGGQRFFHPLCIEAPTIGLHPFVTPSFMLKRSLEYRFDPSRRYTEDFLLLMQLGLDGYRIAILEVALAYVFKKLGRSGASRIS